jgi:hypothetical protein
MDAEQARSAQGASALQLQAAIQTAHSAALAYVMHPAPAAAQTSAQPAVINLSMPRYAQTHQEAPQAQSTTKLHAATGQ